MRRRTSRVGRSFRCIRTVVIAWLLIVLISPWILWSNLAPPNNENHPHHLLQHPKNPLESTYKSSPYNKKSSADNRNSCDDLFGRHQIVEILNGTCLEHKVLKWVSCQIGNIRIDPTLIQGSLGGEPIQEVLNRPEEEETLSFTKGSLMVHSPIPSRLTESADLLLTRFLNAAVVQENVTHMNSVGGSSISSSTLLVRRGNYANPCMVLLTMYNVYIVLEYFAIQESASTIIWLDGHAQGDLDPVWQHLFQTQPVHIKELPANNKPLENAIVVNTMSAIGDEGLGWYGWKDDPSLPNATTTCLHNSTLVDFRDFVLDRYGMTWQRQTTETARPVLTFLVRKDYMAHPRSNGQTDRTLVNVQDDVAHLQSQYPSHTIQVVSFEGLPFDQQLAYITQTDVFVAVHGAGNIHVLFLPGGATFVEYFPKGFFQRRRFRYLAECLNVAYIAKRAWIDQSSINHKIRVRLRPKTPFEQANDSVSSLV
jgi:hypothetical protein